MNENKNNSFFLTQRKVSWVACIGYLTSRAAKSVILSDAKIKMADLLQNPEPFNQIQNLKDNVVLIQRYKRDYFC